MCWITRQKHHFQSDWRRHSLRTKNRHWTWDLKWYKLIFRIPWETTRWWSSQHKVGLILLSCCMEEQGKGWLDHSAGCWRDMNSHLTSPQAQHPHLGCLHASWALPRSSPCPCLSLFSCTNCSSAQQHPIGTIMLSSDALGRWRGLLSLPPSLAGYLSIRPIK